MIECRNIAKGKGKGELIVSSEPISFLGGVNPENGEIIDPNHELKGQIIKDKVLFIPGGKGSTVGSYVIFQMMKNNTAPKAIICLNAEPIIATGAIMSDIPMVDSPEDTNDLVDGALVEVDGDVHSFKATQWSNTTNVAFFRFSCASITDESIVTINEEIV